MNNELVSANNEFAMVSEDSSFEELERAEIRLRELRLKKLENNDKILMDRSIKQDKEIEILNNTIKKLEEEYGGLREATYVLATDDGKMKELTRMVGSLTYSKYTKNNTTLKYKLFHRAIIKDCYKHLYNIYQVNSYKRIKIDDFDESVSSVKRWFANEQNIKRSVNRRLKEYIADKYLAKDKQALVDKFLDEIGGVV